MIDVATIRSPLLRALRGEGLLLVGLVALIGLLVLPISPALLDVLIGVNISIAVILVLMASAIITPTQFAAFPSLLLLVTVFRLSISIAATRSILSRAEAGNIIYTFGHFAAGENLVIGLVVFLIIMAVQFIVIARGAERIAEVSARFSLDSMPGKQLSIDSDLRSGLIEKDEARYRRQLVDLESRLRGGLDGAMKFVKGDAIAGLLIVFVNLLGGLMIGVMQRGMSLSDAVGTYSVLTIGDGLVTQLPALLVTLAAGLIVSRTPDESRAESLMQSVGRQIGDHPRVILMGSCLCAAMALVPGFPAGAFLTLAAVFGGAGLSKTPSARRLLAQRVPRFRHLLVEGDRPQLSIVADQGAPPTALYVEIGNPADAFQAAQFQKSAKTVLDEVAAATGVPLPALSCRLREDGEASWALWTFDVKLASGVLVEPGGEAELARRIGQALYGRMAMFVGVQQTADLLQRITPTHPDLVKEVLRIRSVTKLSEILRRLAEERVSLAGLPLILEAILALDSNEKDAAVLTELVRTTIRAQVLQPYLRDGGLRTIILGADVEANLRSAISGAGSGQQMPLAPETAKNLLRLIAEAQAQAGVDVLLVSFDLRRAVRRLIEPELPGLAVISFAELAPTVRLNVEATVRWPGRRGLAA